MFAVATMQEMGILYFLQELSSSSSSSSSSFNGAFLWSKDYTRMKIGSTQKQKCAKELRSELKMDFCERI
jgi:hypothetical protein